MATKQLGFIIILATLYFQLTCAQIIITTSAGNVSGTTVTGNILTNFSYQAFINIPYAQPPTNTLRFKAPVAYSRAANSTGIINTKNNTVLCPQPLGQYMTVDEDCLILNVYTPVDATSSSKYPVMVWIHGGSFSYGCGALYQPEFLVQESVIVVTVNYRLGALGFLSLGDDNAPGNAGLKDQSLALRWVKNEIENFGGDNSSVTIFGESAGAASVHHHILSSYSSGLFQQAITQSGNAFTSWAYMETGYVDKATSLAQLIGCATNNIVNFTCLQNAPVSDIITYQSLPADIQLEITATGLAFVPVKEASVDAFQNDTVENLQKTVANPVRSIMGINKDEGLIVIKESDVYFQNFLGNLKYFIPTEVMSNLSDAEITTRTDKIKAQYFNDSRPPTLYNYQGYVNLYTDKSFGLPTLQAAQSLLAQNAVVYLYHFNYNGDYRLIVTDAYKLNVPGVNHGDDLGYLFYITYTQQSIASTEAYDVLRKMVKMWSTFATTGKPIPDIMESTSTLYNVTWEPSTSNITKYLAITATPTMVSANFCDTSIVELWNEVAAQPLSGAFLLQPTLALIAVSTIAIQIFTN